MSAIKTNKELVKIAEYIASQTNRTTICEIQTKNKSTFTVFYDTNTDTYEIAEMDNNQDLSLVCKNVGKRKVVFELTTILQNQVAIGS